MKDVPRTKESSTAVNIIPWNSYILTIDGDSILIVFNTNFKLKYVIKLSQNINIKNQSIWLVYDVHGFSEVNSNVPIRLQIIEICKQFESIILSSLSSELLLLWIFLVSTTDNPAHIAAIKLLRIPDRSFNISESMKGYKI